VAWGVGAGVPMVASVSLDRSAKVWSLCGGVLLRTLVFPAALTALALDAADWTLFAGAMNGRIYAAPLSGDACPPEGGGGGAYKLAGHTRPVRALVAAADGRRLVSGSDDGTVKARLHRLRWRCSARADASNPSCRCGSWRAGRRCAPRCTPRARR
jgi:pre-rRNA-processing protein IPI3